MSLNPTPTLLKHPSCHITGEFPASEKEDARLSSGIYGSLVLWITGLS
jgi:hypothetical protein